MKTTEKTPTMMKDEELDVVNGGGWGYNTYHNEDEYKAAGISTDWTLNPFVKDKFKFNGQDISGDTAAKIVFYVRAENPVPGSFGIADALNYAVKHQQEFEADVKAANK